MFPDLQHLLYVSIGECNNYHKEVTDVQLYHFTLTATTSAGCVWVTIVEESFFNLTKTFVFQTYYFTVTVITSAGSVSVTSHGVKIIEDSYRMSGIFRIGKIFAKMIISGCVIFTLSRIFAI